MENVLSNLNIAAHKERYIYIGGDIMRDRDNKEKEKEKRKKHRKVKGERGLVCFPAVC